jgi:hypothetical protein
MFGAELAGRSPMMMRLFAFKHDMQAVLASLMTASAGATPRVGFRPRTENVR